MMKRFLLMMVLCVSILAVPAVLSAQNTGSQSHDAPLTGFASPEEAKAIISEIMDAVGVKASFEVRAAKIPNAAAAVSRGRRFILYNPAFMAAINRATGSNRWAPISILAHEIGHHLNGHTLTAAGSSPSIELEADEFSGFVLRRMGASLEDAQLAMRVISSRRASTTHPARQDRLVAIADGWDKADDQLAGRTPVRTRPRPEPVRETMPKPATPTLVLDEHYIAYDVHFNGDPEGTYHVTVRNNLVKLTENKVSIYGKLMSTNNRSFPLAFKTAGNNVMLVSSGGQILSPAGKKLGYMQLRK